MMDFDGCGACVLACVFPVQKASFRASENHPSIVNPKRSTLNAQPSTLNPAQEQASVLPGPQGHCPSTHARRPCTVP